MRRRAIIPPRRPVFLGAEGKSEAGYAALLARIARDGLSPAIHIHVEVLQPGAGDPLELIERAIQKIHEIERRRTPFWVKAVLLDRGARDKMESAIARARAVGIAHLIWQDPDHEAMLLRHLPGCQHLRPAAGASFEAIRRRWPDYSKGMPAQQLAQRINIEHIRMACTGEPHLRDFLIKIGLL